MATKTFSSRASEERLAFAEALCRQEFGLSYGQYCGTILLDEICNTGAMPRFGRPRVPRTKEQAASFIRDFGGRHHNVTIGKLSDDQMRELVASRYE